MGVLGLLPWVWGGLVLMGAAGARPRVVRVPPGAVMAPALRQTSRVGNWVVVGLVGLTVDLRLGVAGAVLMLVAPVLLARRSRLGHERAVSRELPEVIDLLALALAGGGAIAAAVESVGARPIGPVSAGLATATRLVQRGHRLTDALGRIGPELGEAAQPLVRALTGSEHYGTEVGPILARLATEAREDRRRAAQAEARRVPVRMLMPLVLAILPAFVLLTVVPTLAGTFDGLGIVNP